VFTSNGWGQLTSFKPGATDIHTLQIEVDLIGVPRCFNESGVKFLDVVRIPTGPPLLRPSSTFGNRNIAEFRDT
jgi:hypothetical protein